MWHVPCRLLALGLLLLTAAGHSHAGEDGNGSEPTLTTQQPGEAVTCKLFRGAGASGDTVVCEGRTFELQHPRSSEAEEVEFGSPAWIFYFTCCACCIISAALAAGLTMGLVSLEEFNLDLLLEMRPEELHSEEEKKDLVKDQRFAKAVKPLLSGHFFAQQAACMPHGMDPTNHHYLLVTLLVVNAMANEALPVFLDNLVPAWAAVLISVSFVLVFGEIIPSAVFTGPNQLSIASKFAGCVKVLKIILAPVVWPISLALDKILGHEEEAGYNRGKMKALARLHGGRSMGAANHVLTRDEVDIIHGTLDLHRRAVSEIEEKIETAKGLPLSAVLDDHTVADILHFGCARLFVYDGDPRNVRGMVLVRKLIAVNPEDKRPLNSIPLRKPIVLSCEETLLNTLNKFQTGRSHLALVSKDPKAVKQAWETNTPIPEHALPTGFLTLEDVFEELLQEEIFDEEDREEIVGTLQKAGKLQRLKSLAAKSRKTVESRRLGLVGQESSESSALPSLQTPLIDRYKASTTPPGIFPSNRQAEERAGP